MFTATPEKWFERIKDTFFCEPSKEMDPKDYYQTLVQERDMVLSYLLLEKSAIHDISFREFFQNWRSNEFLNNPTLAITTLDNRKHNIEINNQNKMDVINHFHQKYNEILTKALSGNQFYKELSDNLNFTFQDITSKNFVASIKRNDLFLDLIIAICYCGAHHLLEIFLKKYPQLATIDLTRHYYSSCLNLAIDYFRYDTVKLLLTYGADVNKTTASQYYWGDNQPATSPLQLALEVLYLTSNSKLAEPLIKLLLEQGANPSLSCFNCAFGKTDTPYEFCLALLNDVKLKSDVRSILAIVIQRKPIEQNHNCRIM